MNRLRVGVIGLGCFGGRHARVCHRLSHVDLEAMQWMARKRIARVYAQKIKRLGNRNEDALYAVVSFENGAIGSLGQSWACPDALLTGAPFVQDYREAFDAIPGLDALAQSARTGLPVDMKR